MRVLHSVHPDDFKTYNTDLIRKSFLLTGLRQTNQANFIYTHYDRMVIGIIQPGDKNIPLNNYENLKSKFFLERREMGIINTGGDGMVTAGDENFLLKKLDCLYIGRGTSHVNFSSRSSKDPSVFFILSCPAHNVYSTTFMSHGDSVKTVLGSQQTSNHRTICKYINREGIHSCQLIMGLTLLHQGNVWNTMPPHTHDRRMEVYYYFDVPDKQKVFHYMGLPDETRHILIGNHDTVVSPPWSIHAGCGTSNYGFIWGMAGENMDYADMDEISLDQIK